MKNGGEVDACRYISTATVGRILPGGEQRKFNGYRVVSVELCLYQKRCDSMSSKVCRELRSMQYLEVTWHDRGYEPRQTLLNETNEVDLSPVDRHVR